MEEGRAGEGPIKDHLSIPPPSTQLHFKTKPKRQIQCNLLKVSSIFQNVTAVQQLSKKYIHTIGWNINSEVI